jgi:hypothetical protein
MAQLSHSHGIAVLGITHMAQMLQVSHVMAHMAYLPNSHGTAVISTTRGMIVIRVIHMT